MYAILCNYASEDDHCWPSHSTLAGKLSCSVTSVKKYLSELIDVKLIAVRREQYRSCIYYMLRPDALKGAVQKTVREQPKIACVQSKTAPLNTLSKHEEKTNPPLPPVAVPRSVTPASRPVRCGDFSFQDFEKAWEAYPKKTAFGLARHAWKTLCQRGELPPLPEILASINRFMTGESWKRENGRYIPQFSNFLTGQRWLDPLSEEEEAVNRARLEAERIALTHKREEVAAEARSDAKRQRLRPIYDAFAARFGGDARQDNERRDAMLFGTWMHLHEKYGGPTAADVLGDTTLDILDFLKAYQRRRDAEAYQTAQQATQRTPVPADNSHACNREHKPTLCADMLHSGSFLTRFFPAVQPLCAAAV